VEPLAGKRKIEVTLQRKKSDFAYFIKELITQGYSHAKKYDRYWITSIFILPLHSMKPFQKMKQTGCSEK